MTSALTITDEELAPLIQRRPAWLRKHYETLRGEHGLPSKLPGGWSWSRPAVLRWLETYGMAREDKALAGENAVLAQRDALMAAFGRAA